MRTLPEAINCLREVDEETALTLHGLRKLISEGRIPYVLIGTKRLVNMDVLEKFLESRAVTSSSEDIPSAREDIKGKITNKITPRKAV